MESLFRHIFMPLSANTGIWSELDDIGLNKSLIVESWQTVFEL
jgi:hypothetical protein